MAANVNSLLRPPTQAIGGYGATPYAGQFKAQSMTVSELSFWSSAWKIVKTTAPVVISMLEVPIPSAGGIGQQSSGQVLQAMAAGQISPKQLTVAQMSWVDTLVKHLPDVIDAGKVIFQMFEAKQGVSAASFGAMSAQGITAQDFDAASQAIRSGKFSVANMQLQELGIFESLLPQIIQIIGAFSKVPNAPQGVAQQDFNSVLGTINQVADAVPNIVNAVGQVVKLINSFRSQSVQGQSISSMGIGSWIGGAVGGIAGSLIAPGAGTAIGGNVGAGIGNLIESFF